MKKLIIAMMALMLLLCACSVPTSGKIDYGSFEGYYSMLAYEVRGDDGVVTEQMYVLCTDKDFENPAGKKDVFFDADSGEMSKYTVTIGVDEISEIVSYTSGEGSSYYSEMYFEGGAIARTVWDNSYPDENGVLLRSKGEQTYYTDGVSVKTFVEEAYRDGVLETTTTREYAEDGSVKSETVE